MQRVLLMIVCVALLISLVGCGGEPSTSSSDVDVSAITSSDVDVSTTTNSDVDVSATTSSDAGVPTSKTSVSRNTTSTTKISAPKGVQWPKIDVTGDTVKYLWWIDPGMLNNPDTWIYRMNELLKKNYGTQLEIISTSYEELPTKAAQLVLSGNSPDLVFYKAQDYPNFIIKNLVQPVDDYINFSGEYWSKVKTINDKFSWNNKHYLVVPCMSQNYITLYWKSLFEDAGLKTPYEYYKEGNWTWDTMLELARKLTSDEDGDENPDVWGFATHPAFFYQTTGVDLVNIDKGVVTNNLRNPSLARAMKFLYDAGPQKYNVRTTDLSKWESLFPRGRLAMLLQEDYVKETYINLIKEGKVGIAPAPKDPEASEYIIPGKIEASWIPKGAKNVKGAVAYLTTVMMSKQDPELVTWSRQKDKELYNFSDEQLDLLTEMNKKLTLFYPQYTGMGNFGNKAQWEMWGELYTWNLPWETEVEKFYPILQAQIDEVKDAYKAAKTN